MDAYEEREIIEAVLDGDAGAYAVLVRRYERPLFGLMMRLTRNHDDALELSQDTFLRAYDRLEQFRAGGRFFPWLYAIGLNVGREFLRRKRLPTVSVEAFETEPAAFGLPPEQETALLAKATAAEMDAALERLTVETREALILRYREDLSLEEVARSLDISMSAVKMRLSRGIARLKRMLTEDGHEAHEHAGES